MGFEAVPPVRHGFRGLRKASREALKGWVGQSWTAELLAFLDVVDDLDEPLEVPTLGKKS